MGVRTTSTQVPFGVVEVDDDGSVDRDRREADLTRRGQRRASTRIYPARSRCVPAGRPSTMPELVAALPRARDSRSRRGRSHRTGSTSAPLGISHVQEEQREHGRPALGLSPAGRVLVTGADGFIGWHVVERCSPRAPTVTAFCLYNSFGSLGLARRLRRLRRGGRDGRAEVVLGDIRDAEHVRSALGRTARLVLHLAALIAIPLLATRRRGRTSRPTSSARSTCSRPCATTTSSGWCTPPPPRSTARPTRCRSPSRTR